MDYTLFELEKDYYLGNYQSCINKANSMETSEESIFYLCLSYFHLKKYDLLKLEFSKSKYPSINLVSLLLSYTKDVNERETILSKIESMLDDKKSVSTGEELSKLVMSSIFIREKQFTNALRCLNHLESLPAMLSRINVYLAMNRVDIAERQLKVMQNKDDYATLTLLAIAQVKLAAGNAREAYDIAKELEDKYKATPLLNNLQAAAAISMGRFDLAKQHCENSLDLDNDNLEAMINMIYILTKLKGSSEVKDRHFSRIQAIYSDHEYVQEMQKMEREIGA